MKYKAFAIDLDGTLTNSRKEITLKTLETLLEAQSRGLKLILASGRPVYGIMPLAEQLKMKQFGGAILAFNGGVLYDLTEEKTVFEQCLSLDIIPYLHRKSQESHTTIMTYEGPTVITEDSDNKYVQHAAKLNKLPIKQVSNFSKSITKAPNKCLIVGEPSILLSLEQEIIHEVGDKINVFRSEDFFLELVPKGIDKAASLKILIDYMKIDQQTLMAAGDSYNDISMIKFAGLGIAMANAKPEVLSVADFVTLSNEEDGVAYVVEKFVKD